MNLRNVPDDEAADVRALLDANRIAFYETVPNRWGISAGAIWVKDASDIIRARQLMADYQRERQARARADYADAQREGTNATLWTVIRDDPMRVLIAIVTALLLLGLLVLPVFLISRS